MSQMRVARRVVIGGVVAVVMVFALPFVAGAVTVTGLVGVLAAAAGQGWAAHPDQTAGGSEQFVEGPLIPPSGRESLEMTVAGTSDRALVFAVPKPGSGATVPGDFGAINPTPWGNLSGSFSTFTTNAAAAASSVPALKTLAAAMRDGTRDAAPTSGRER
jgi:hypothetical protein